MSKEEFVGKLKKLPQRWFIDAFSGMASGLFCTLIAGTIIAQIGSWCGDNVFGSILVYFGSIAKMLMGAGIGVGIAYKLKAKPLVIFSAAVTGLIGAAAVILILKTDWVGLKPMVSIVRENFSDWFSWVLFAAATVASLFFKIGPIPIIVAGGLLGLLFC